ncbi:MAG: protein kinase [Polyangia bacterium]
MAGVSSTRVPPTPIQEPAAAPAPPQRIDEYEIQRPLGAGSMGQVYQALDTMLGRLVAVKFIASASPGEAARERFLVEARAIARLHHPNILSIYRVGIFEGRPYLVSEYLSGTSLDKVALPLPWTQVLDLSLQLARGLAAAHRQGVLHRDIKPANVMLTLDGTAKLLDFGLAKLGNERPTASTEPVGAAPPPVQSPEPRAREESAGTTLAPQEERDAALPRGVGEAEDPSGLSGLGDLGGFSDLGHADTLAGDPRAGAAVPSQPARSLTAAGALLGTPDYMSPEAWRAEPATCRGDIYSLGVLLYELCAGRPPHSQARVEDLYLDVQHKDAPALAAVAPRVNRGLAALIDRCLRRDPAARFASGDELLQALEALRAELSLPSVEALLRRTLRRRWPLLLATALLLLLPSGVALYHAQQVRAERHLPEPQPRERRAVAVIGLVDLDGGAPRQGFAAAFAELLALELAASERLRRVPEERVTQMKVDLRLVEQAAYPPEVLARIRQYLGSELLVSGTYRADPARPGRLRLSIGVQDARSGTGLGPIEVGGSPAELFELVAQTGRELRSLLQVAEQTPVQAAALRAAWPQSAAVAELYAQGREHLRRFDPVGARRLLEQVVAADPDYSLGHLAFAEVWTALGHDEKARLETQRAFALSANLPREARYLIEARHHEAAKEWPQALAAYRMLLGFFPDSLDYGLYLANAQLLAGQPEAALATATKLRRLPAPASQDPRLDLVEARSAADRSDYGTALLLLASAARKGEAIGAPLIVARARLEEAYAYSSLGEQERALQSAAAAQPLSMARGDRAATADALMAMSAAYMYQGNIDQSLAASQEALSLLFEIQNSSLSAANLCNMALLSIKKGDLTLARSRAESGVLLAREINLLDSQGAGLIALGWLTLLQGDPAQSVRFFAKARASFEELGDPKMVAWAHWHLGQALLARGELASARRHHLEGLGLRERHGLKGFAAESQLGLAAVALEEGSVAEAEHRTRAAIPQFVSDGQRDEEAWAQALLGRALLLQGRRDEADRAIERARALITASQNRVVRLSVQRLLAASQLEHATGTRRRRAEQDLTAVHKEAAAAGLVNEAFEAQLALYRTMASRRAAKSILINNLSLFQREAARRGLGLITKKARSVAVIAIPDH